MKRIYDMEPFFQQTGIEGRSLDKGANHELVHLKLEAGAFLKPHKTPFGARFVVFSGNGELIIGDEILECSKGSIIECEGEIPHGIRNSSDKTMEVLVIKKL